MAVLLTRPEADSQRIAADLGSYGIESLIWSLTRIELSTAPIDVPADTGALVFSSGHAIRAFCAASARRDLTVFCVGTRTAALAEAQGFEDVHAAGGNFDALVEMLRDFRPESVLYLRGKDVTGDLREALRGHEIAVRSEIVYSAIPAGPPDVSVQEAFLAGKVVAITIWSRRNAELLNESIHAHDDWKITDISLIAISESAAAPLGNVGFRRIIIASRPNATQMIAEIRAALR